MNSNSNAVHEHGPLARVIVRFHSQPHGVHQSVSVDVSGLAAFYVSRNESPNKQINTLYIIN